MLACFAPQLTSAFVLLALLALAARWFGWGLCKRCETHRTPKCGCPGGNPEERVRRIRWPKIR